MFITKNIKPTNRLLLSLKTCYVKYAINSLLENQIKINEKEGKNKYFIDEVLEKFTQALRIRIIRNNEDFRLYHNLGYLEELCHEDGIEPLFPHVVSLKMELSKKV